ncbi:unnamed protein product [Mortierella alpina]
MPWDRMGVLNFEIELTLWMFSVSRPLSLLSSSFSLSLSLSLFFLSLSSLSSLSLPALCPLPHSLHPASALLRSSSRLSQHQHSENRPSSPAIIRRHDLHLQ